MFFFGARHVDEGEVLLSSDGFLPGFEIEGNKKGGLVFVNLGDFSVSLTQQLGDVF